MLNVKKKVSSNSRKAVIKAGTLSSAKWRCSLVSGRERGTVMSLIQRSEVVNPPKHSICARM